MANLTNSAKLIAEMEKKANLTDLPDVYNSTVTVVVNGNTGSNTFSTNQPSNSTLKVTVGKSDVGLGNVDNTSDVNKPISTATQAALDLKADKSDISSVYKYKGSVANYESLPSSGQTVGDVYNVEAAHTTAPKFDAGANVAWDGTAWDVLGGNVDLSNYPTNSDVLTKTNTTSFTPSGDYQPATKKYVDDSVSSIEPSNTKTFFLPGVGATQAVLTVAQAAWDRYKAGKDPIIIYDNKAYTVFTYQGTGQTALTFASSGVGNKDGNSDSNRMFALIRIIASSDVVSYVSSTTNDTPGKYLRTDYNYSTPYTPTYNGSPATKKYVDDTIASAKSSGATAPSNPTEGQLWYDTTNDVLKVYDGTNWNEIGGGDVKVFEVPAVNDDISDMVTRISAGKGVILHEMVSGTDAFYKVDYHDDVNCEITASLIYSYNGGYARVYTIEYNYSTKRVITKTPSLIYFFAPETAGTQGQVLTKTASGYEWQAPIEPTVISGDSGTTYTIKVSDTAPASGTASNIITFVTD